MINITVFSVFHQMATIIFITCSLLIHVLSIIIIHSFFYHSRLIWIFKQQKVITRSFLSLSQSLQIQCRNLYQNQKKAIESTFSWLREFSIQEATTLALPELWLPKSYPKTIFVYNSVPSNSYHICKSKDDLKLVSIKFIFSPDDNPSKAIRNVFYFI